MKIRMICEYEDGQNVSGSARELGFAISTVNITVQDSACIEKYVYETAMIN
jgi:hypothetical protein